MDPFFSKRYFSFNFFIFQVLGDESKRGEYDSPYSGGAAAGGNPFGGNRQYQYETKVRTEKKQQDKPHYSRKAHRKVQAAMREAELYHFTKRMKQKWKKDWYKHLEGTKRKKNFWVRAAQVLAICLPLII